MTFSDPILNLKILKLKGKYTEGEISRIKLSLEIESLIDEYFKNLDKTDVNLDNIVDESRKTMEKLRGNMPYIKQDQRKKLIIEGNAENAGDLNYSFTLMITRYLAYHGLSYQRINDVLGALEGAKLEFVRRVVNNYEDKKIIENGDVYE